MTRLADTTTVSLTRGWVDAVVLPLEGGVLAQLRVAGRSVLAETPWADAVGASSTPANSEADWVDRWRGGWQLCFPSAGAADPGSRWPQGFHGVASQAGWEVTAASIARVSLRWHDEFSLTVERTWQLTDSGARVETVVRNGGPESRPIVVAEHLILGGDILAPVLEDDAELRLTPPAESRLAALDYDGHPQAGPEPWPGHRGQRWERIDRATPARVAALVDLEPGVILIEGDHVTATVAWQGLPHALLWEELAHSAEPPWNGSVVALGIEPTSAPHGRGTTLAEGTITLEPGDVLAWQAELAIDWHGEAAPSTPPTPQEQP